METRCLNNAQLHIAGSEFPSEREHGEYSILGVNIRRHVRETNVDLVNAHFCGSSWHRCLDLRFYSDDSRANMAPILSEISSSVSVPLRTDISVPQLLQDNYSGTSPDKVIYEDTLTGKTFTYSEFRHAVRSLAAGLRKEGFKAGDKACVVGPNCVQYPLIVHAVWWIGGIIRLFKHHEDKLGGH